MLPSRLLGLPRLHSARRGEPTILSLVPGLLKAIQESARIRKRPLAGMESRGASAQSQQHAIGNSQGRAQERHVRGRGALRHRSRPRRRQRLPQRLARLTPPNPLETSQGGNRRSGSQRASGHQQMGIL